MGNCCSSDVPGGGVEDDNSLHEDKLAILEAFRNVQRLPRSWRVENKLENFTGVELSIGSNICVPSDVVPVDEQQQQQQQSQNQRVCDDELTITISLNSRGLSGTIDFARLPERTVSLSLFNNLLEGLPDLSHLPPRLEYLMLGVNNFSGTGLDLRHLPPTLKFLSLRANNLEGRLDLRPLRRIQLTQLLLQENAFIFSRYAPEDVEHIQDVDFSSQRNIPRSPGMEGSDGSEEDRDGDPPPRVQSSTPPP